MKFFSTKFSYAKDCILQSGRRRHICLYSSVAEHWSRKPGVVSSNLTGGITFVIFISISKCFQIVKIVYLRLIRLNMLKTRTKYNKNFQNIKKRKILSIFLCGITQKILRMKNFTFVAIPIKIQCGICKIEDVINSNLKQIWHTLLSYSIFKMK